MYSLPEMFNQFGGNLKIVTSKDYNGYQQVYYFKNRRLHNPTSPAVMVLKDQRLVESNYYYEGNGICEISNNSQWENYINEQLDTNRFN
jgi:hypothetical protein